MRTEKSELCLPMEGICSRGGMNRGIARGVRSNPLIFFFF